MKKCIFLLLVCFASSAIWAKCGNSAIVIDGSIPGSVTGSTISVQVVPDPNWDSQPAAIIDANGQFHMTVFSRSYATWEPGKMFQETQNSHSPAKQKWAASRGSQSSSQARLYEQGQHRLPSTVANHSACALSPGLPQ